MQTLHKALALPSQRENGSKNIHSRKPQPHLLGWFSVQA